MKLTNRNAHIALQTITNAFVLTQPVFRGKTLCLWRRGRRRWRCLAKWEEGGRDEEEERKPGQGRRWSRRTERFQSYLYFAKYQ